MNNMEKDKCSADIGTEVPEEIDEQANYMGIEEVVNWCYEFMGVEK